MIQDIGEHRFDLSFRQPEARDEDYVLYMKSNKTLLRKAEDGNYEIPRFSDFPMEKVRLKMKAYYLFAIDGTGYYYVREMLQGEEDGYEFCPTSVFRKMTPMYQAFAGITATQLHRWKGQADEYAVRDRTQEGSGVYRNDAVMGSHGDLRQEVCVGSRSAG